MEYDRNTFQPVNLPGLAATIGTNQTQTQTAAPTTSTVTSTGQERTSQAVQSINNQINTTPGALAALEQLITQLSDRPNISKAELNQQYPLAQMQWSGNGWIGVNPTTGLPMSSAEMTQFNRQQEAKRAQATAAAGTTPGGSVAQQATATERSSEIERTRKLQGDYSKSAAMSDADFLINKSIKDALELAMPQITAGLEGAGTSKSTLGAALTQKAATKGAVEGGALGANLSVAYGQISNQLEVVLEQLTRSDPNSPTALLLQAIIGSKGLVSAGTQSQTSSGVASKSGVATTVAGPTSQVTTVDRNPVIPAAGAPLIGQQALGMNAGNAYASSGGPSFYAIRETTQAPSVLDSTYQNLFNSGTSDYEDSF